MAEYPLPAAEATIRVCEQCNQLRPLAEFFGKDHTCKTCHQLLTQEDANKRCERLEQALTHKALAMMATRAKRERLTAPHITEAVSILVRDLGGLEGMIGKYVDHILRAAEDKPGSRLVLDQFRYVTQLIIASTEHRGTAPDVAGMTDEELEAEFATISLRSIVSDPKKLLPLLGFIREHEPKLLEFEGDGEG